MEEIPTNKQGDLKIFHDLIAMLKEVNKDTIRFEKINPTELGEEDEEFYDEYVCIG